MQRAMDDIVFWITIFMAIPLFKNGFAQFTAWSQQRRITLTEKEITFMQRLHESNRALALFIAKYAFMIAGVICINLMFTSLETTALGVKIYMMAMFMTGGIGYAMGVYMAGTINRLEKYDETIASLQKKLQKLRGDELQPGG